jgi:hypothetical protein
VRINRDRRANRPQDILLAKSRPSRHLPLLSTYAAHLVGRMRG